MADGTDRRQQGAEVEGADLTGVDVAGLEAMLCFDLYAASRAMTATYRPILAEHGLTYPQYLVLVALWTDDDVTIKHLATTLRLDHATLTPLLRRLEERGLIHRAAGETDRRSVRVHLSPDGERLRPIADDVHCAVTEATGLAPASLVRLQEELRTLTERLLRRAQEAEQRG